MSRAVEASGFGQVRLPPPRAAVRMRIDVARCRDLPRSATPDSKPPRKRRYSPFGLNLRIWGFESRAPPQMCRSTNRRSSVAEPEVWFRIVYLTPKGDNGEPVAAYREQTVEIALVGPKGAFESGNIGTLTRRVPADRVVSAVPPLRGRSKLAGSPRRPGWLSCCATPSSGRPFSGPARRPTRRPSPAARASPEPE